MKPTGKVRPDNFINYYLHKNNFTKFVWKGVQATISRLFFSKFKDLATVFDERTTVLALSTLFHQKAEQYKENVPKVRISCFNFPLNSFRLFITRENDRNISAAKSWVICKSSILPSYKVPDDCKLFEIAQLLPLLIFVSVSTVKKNQRVLRENVKHKIRSQVERWLRHRHRVYRHLHSGGRYHSRFFVHFGHESTYASRAGSLYRVSKKVPDQWKVR